MMKYLVAAAHRCPYRQYQWHTRRGCNAPSDNTLLTVCEACSHSSHMGMDTYADKSSLRQHEVMQLLATLPTWLEAC